MWIVDTPIWKMLFRRKNLELAQILRDPVLSHNVLLHPYVFGEMLLGGIPPEVDEWVDLCTPAPRASDEDAYDYIDLWRPRGVGWVDTHLIISAHISGATIWTTDGKLLKASHAVGVQASAQIEVPIVNPRRRYR